MPQDMVITVFTISFVVLMVICVLWFFKAYSKFRRLGNGDISPELSRRLVNISSRANSERVLGDLKQDFPDIDIERISSGCKNVLEWYLNSLSVSKAQDLTENTSDTLKNRLSSAIADGVLKGIKNIAVKECNLTDYVKQDGFARLGFGLLAEYTATAQDGKELSKSKSFDILVIYTVASEVFWIYADISTS